MPGVTFVVLGGTSDLSRSKLIPSLHSLHKAGALPDLDIIGTTRRDISETDFQKMLVEKLPDAEAQEEFRPHIRLVRMDFHNEEDYAALEAAIETCGDLRLFYLATLPSHFEIITRNLASRRLVKEDSKLIYEKPFGDDLESARKLNESVGSLFSEEKIYRIDHYLGKELVDNITYMRFANRIVEPLWCRDHVDHIQIIASEESGVSERGGFYDNYGAIKDFFQSHLLQLLALVTMGRVETLDAESIRDAKVAALRDVLIKRTITGQYEGYRQEDGVASDSTTETLVAVVAAVENETWRGVPIFMVSGKRLGRKYGAIYVQFKDGDCSILGGGGCGLQPNALVISIQPEGGIHFRVNTKVPGEDEATQSRMEFCYSCQHGPNTPEAYENLLLEAVEGDRRSFVRYDESEESWKIVESLDVSQPFVYPPDSFPKEVREFIGKRRWYEPE